MGIHFTKPLTAFRQIMMYLKMMKKSFTEVFFRSSMNNGRGKAKLLPPPISDQMAEMKEYEYRKKHYGMKENVQKNGGIGNDSKECTK